MGRVLANQHDSIKNQGSPDYHLWHVVSWHWILLLEKFCLKASIFARQGNMSFLRAAYCSELLVCGE